MIFTDLDPRISAALISAIIAGMVAGISVYFNHRKLKHEIALSERSSFVAREILRNSKEVYVSHAFLIQVLGGYSENEVRKLVLSVGGIRFRDSNKVEVWALYSRLPHEVKKQLVKHIPAAVDDPPRADLLKYEKDPE